MKTIEEVDKFIVEKAKEQREKFAKVNAEYKLQFENNELFAGDICSNYITESMPFDMKMRNMMVYLDINMVAGLYYEHENISLHRRLKKEITLKQAMFLFILRNGLMAELQEFVKCYSGDLEEDIYDEYCALK